jgi:hypothetical protein
MQIVDPEGSPSQLSADPYKLTLWGKTAQYYGWFPVCYAPCNAAVYATDSYQIRGLRIPPSAEFTLPRSGEVSLQVKPGRYRYYVGGIVLAALSGPFIIQSLTTLVVGDTDVRIAGASLLAGGIGILIGGMVMTARNRSTINQAL